MYRIDDPSASPTLPAPEAALTEGYWTEGSPGAGIPATLERASWFNMIQEELRAIVIAGGLTPSKTIYNQVLTAIQTLKQTSGTNYAIDSGTANAYIATLSPAPEEIPDGMPVTVSINYANTTDSTLNVNGLTPGAHIVGGGFALLQGGEFVSGGTYNFVYHKNSTQWFLVGQCGGALQVGTATASEHAMQFGQATGRLIAVRTFTTNATYTPTAGTNSVIVEIIGGGGGGGGSGATSAGQVSIGAGGGSGAYAKSYLTNGFSGAAMTIGTAGAGAAVGGAGFAGGTTSFGALLSAVGGVGGQVGPASPNIYTLLGAGGGALPTSGNLVNAKGTDGTPGVAASGSSFISGAGGSSCFGGGGSAIGSINAGGKNATTFGAGGGGAATGPSSSGLTGGGGAAGVIIVYEYA